MSILNKLLLIIKKELYYLLLSTILVILPWFWIPKRFVYTSEEPNFINYDIKLEKASTMWTKDYGFGSAGDPSNQSLLIPNAVFYDTMRELGVDRSSTQKLFISFLFLSIAIGFRWFSSLFTTSSFVRSLGLSAYLFNFYMVGSLGYTAKIKSQVRFTKLHLGVCLSRNFYKPPIGCDLLIDIFSSIFILSVF